jgi:hypothetical protein
MKVIQAIVFVANVLLLLIADAFLWTISWRWGLGGIIGIVGFFIGYSLSGGMTLAPRDYWRNSKYAIFKKKLAYGNSIAGATAVIASFVLMVFDV